MRPHPHIGLSTLTYLYDGEITHRDNLGVKAAIRPGEVNWMTAGRGIVHSERTAPERRLGDEPLHGLQFWVAMPRTKEEIDPSFAHLDGQTLPTIEAEGKKIRVVAGGIFGIRSTLRTLTETLFADVTLQPARRCRSMPSTKSARSMCRPARSTSPATVSGPAGSSSSGPATRSRSRQ